MTLNRDDIRGLYDAWTELRDDPHVDGPQVEMTSGGYVDLWPDGEVTAHGQRVLDLTTFEADHWSPA